MGAAAEGRSTLGIPASVGREFIASGPASGHLPERKSGRRGKRGSGKGHKAGDPAEHLKHLHDAHGSGDHVSARKHAFAFVRALDAKHGPPAKTAVMKAVPPMANVENSTPAERPKANPSRLVAALRASRKA